MNTDSLLSTLIPNAPDGTMVSLWNPSAYDYIHTTTFTSSAWDNGDPLLVVGEAAFFNIGPSAAVPEPSVAGLMIVGLCLARVVSRRS